jgi:beta-lactam-binding protein with PASTA domain
MTKEKAIKSLTDSGFKIEIIKDSEPNKGKVVFQSPEANTFVDFGSTISLKIEVEDEQTTTSTTTSTTESSSNTSQTSTSTPASTSTPTSTTLKQ